MNLFWNQFKWCITNVVNLVNIVNFRRGHSYIDSPNWIKKEKATTNPKNKDDKCFKYVVTVALNYEETKSHPERVSNIKPFINKYNCKGLNH